MRFGDCARFPFFLLVISLSHQVAARFTLKTCWYQDCVSRTAAGSMCYVPDSKLATTPCTGVGHADLSTAFETHMRQDLSIAYYDGLDNVRLGGVDFNVPSDGSIVRLCLSGMAVGGSFFTLCLNAVGDNVLWGDSLAYCRQRRVPAAVSDGCYNITAGNSTSMGPTSPTSTSIRKNSAVSVKGFNGFFLFFIYICQYFST